MGSTWNLSLPQPVPFAGCGWGWTRSFWTEPKKFKKLKNLFSTSPSFVLFLLSTIASFFRYIRSSIRSGTASSIADYFRASCCSYLCIQHGGMLAAWSGAVGQVAQPPAGIATVITAARSDPNHVTWVIWLVTAIVAPTALRLLLWCRSRGGQQGARERWIKRERDLWALTDQR